MNAGVHIKKVLLFYSADWELWKILGAGFALLFSVLIKVIFPAVVLVVLVLLDMRFGIKKHIKRRVEKGDIPKSQRSFKNIRSGGVRRTFSKIADYLIVVMAFIAFEGLLEYMEVNVKYHNFTLSNLMVFLLCLNELKSIDENLKELRGIGLLKSAFDFVLRRKSVNEIILDKNEESN